PPTTTRPPTTTAPPTTTTSQQCLPIGLLVTPSTVSIGNQLTIQAVSYYPYVWVRIRNAENNNEEIPGTVCNNCFECTDCSSPAPYVWTWRPIATSQGSYQIYFIGSLVDPPNPNSWCPSNVVSYSIVTTPGTTAPTPTQTPPPPTTTLTTTTTAPTPTQTTPVSATPTVGTTRPSTTTLPPPNLFIKLKGDYDRTFEYSKLFINNEDKGKICENCNINCSLQEPIEAASLYINLDKYCSDESGKGIIEIKFVDSDQVNECPSTYKVCLKLEQEYCCERTCLEQKCKYVAFDCDNWSCLDLKDFMIKRVECRDEECNVLILRNVINSKLKGSIIIYDNDNGKIYYLGVFDIPEKFVGLRVVRLAKVDDCENGDLKIVLNIIKGNEIIYTLRAGEYIC
ncbi:MAG: hypothetical protein N3E38_02765, partial [Candidatus Aenigmarchaeota archaeon]|nr:hypothetical protein [Candidatus Aenigmarchaeota archaeon]